ncbi:hypothetical protein FF38_03737 [Lucilia cuprina]|uniref:Myb/SANT-like domain-containing protein n=1 Tax=Lucilia cuprina TaxID=7375 RepID=A0A0L0C889_LUCCU|nr:hypothetical protein CVS40_3422 [Lucilia cuprina]KNC28447.1 hypothetical protein FF38_03737 [Lucilia cuprina]
MSANTNVKIKRKREKLNNKRWTDAEIKQLLEYLQERQGFEKPTAQIFYRKFLQVTELDASWDIVRWKVKNLKSNYNKAETWRKSTGAGLLEADEGVSSIN